MPSVDEAASLFGKGTESKYLAADHLFAEAMAAQSRRFLQWQGHKVPGSPCAAFLNEQRSSVL
jgi:hypothetical protein